MMCQVADDHASLATLDLQLPDHVLIGTFAKSSQTVTGIQGESKDRGIRSRVGLMFPNGLDVLFIDGDHSLEGVSNDFRT